MPTIYWMMQLSWEENMKPLQLMLLRYSLWKGQPPLLQSTWSKEKKKCRYCDGLHPFKPRELCPAHGAKCHKCGIVGHWAKACHSEKEAGSQPRRHPHHKEKTQHRPPPRKRTSQKHQNSKIHEVDLQEFQQMSFDSITFVDSVQSNTTDEIMTDIHVKLPGNPLEHNSRVKADSGAKGNLLPLRTFRKMFPSKLDQNWQPSTAVH